MESFILFPLYSGLRWNDICVWDAPQVPCVGGLVPSMQQLEVSSILRQQGLVRGGYVTENMISKGT